MNPHSTTSNPGQRVVRALCAGQWKTFDSIDPLLSAIARDLCDTCPVLMECRQQRDTWLASSTTARASVEGTWAGRTYGGELRNRRAAAAQRASRARAAKAKGEAPEVETHCFNGHLYDEANTYRNPRTGKRFCRACRAADARAARAARQARASKENAA
jgi:hypothetical protein